MVDTMTKTSDCRKNGSVFTESYFDMAIVCQVFD